MIVEAIEKDQKEARLVGRSGGSKICEAEGPAIYTKPRSNEGSSLTPCYLEPHRVRLD